MSAKKAEKQPFGSPLEELSYLLSRLEERISGARASYRSAIVNPPEESPQRKSRFSFGSLRRAEKKKQGDGEDKRSSSFDESVSSADRDVSSVDMDSSGSGRANSNQQDVKAKFIDIPDQEEFIEDLRRAAELIIIGENYVTNLQKKKEKKWERAKEKWSANKNDLLKMSDDDDEVPEEEQKDDEDNIRMGMYEDLFDHFFERNALDMIVNMLTGASFDFSEEVSQARAIEKSPESGNTDVSKDSDDPEKKATNRLAKAVAEHGALLPPLAIATQAVQSLAIMIQNVSRATSMYVILSNNHVNKLISLPLELYSAAEKRRQKESTDESLPRNFASPELAELTTHFVTFLKSLAMRMNTQTLQFFLKYPAESAGVGAAMPVSNSHFSEDQSFESEDGQLPSMSPRNGGEQLRYDLRDLQVDFPLYDRALEFCAAHQDSFVRLTAINICLNTLRLATVSSREVEDSPGKEAPSPRGETPDGILHNSDPLPFREQIAIARHTCAPSRVERLIAPMFTKLAERWNSIEEQLREIDASKGMATGEGGDLARAKNEKVAMAKEKVRRERLIRAFKDKAADLQDELLFLDDVFKVGLTVLNEQMIEMMLATFVYPLLLQPLLLYSQRLAPLLESYGSQTTQDHPFQRFGDFEGVEHNLATVSGPAKAALFTLASVFQFLTNHSLLRLLFTALFHPLSPDSTSAPTVRSTLEEATIGADGKATLRLDEEDSHVGLIPDARTTYAFGKHSKTLRRDASDGRENAEECVFVLSPALAEVLEFRGKDFALIARTRPNPYRQALLRFLDIPHEITGIRELSVCAMDAALSIFDGKFLADILFGSDLKTFADDMPADERNLDSAYAHSDDDRGMGGAAVVDSRHMAIQKKGGSVGSDLTGEVVNALCASIVYATRTTSGPWKLDFDDLAAHALLCSIRKNGRAMMRASKSIENCRREMAAFIVERPDTIHSPMGGSALSLKGSPGINAPDYDEKMFGSIMNMFFFDYSDSPEMSPVVEEFLRLKVSPDDEKRTECSLIIASQNDFDAMCNRIGKFLLDDLEPNSDNAELQTTRSSAGSLLKVDALLTLARDLVDTGGVAFKDTSFAGIAISPGGVMTNMKGSGIRELTRQIVCPISNDMNDALFAQMHDDGEFVMPIPGSIIPLVGSPAIPCVCETPASAAHLFASEDSSVVAEGVTWQSLYLVFLRGYLVFAQPVEGRAGGDGRVIAVSSLERLDVEQDSNSPTNNGSPARRLLLSHKDFNQTPPPLFLFDELPNQNEYGPFFRNQTFTSGVDVWFEHQKAATHAYKVLATEMFKAKSERGRRMQEYLAPKFN